MLQKSRSALQNDFTTSNMSQTTGSAASRTDLPAVNNELSRLTQDVDEDGGQNVNVQGPDYEANLSDSETDVLTLPSVSPISTEQNNLGKDVKALDSEGLQIRAKVTQQGICNSAHSFGIAY
jgi:hypothetical protein